MDENAARERANEGQDAELAEARIEEREAEAELMALVDGPAAELPAADAPDQDAAPRADAADASRLTAHAVPIEAMPAAPEADRGTHDADAPAWATSTGSPMYPTGERAAAAVPGPIAAEPAAPVASGPGVHVSGDRVEVGRAGASRVEGREVTINQGGAAIIHGDRVHVEQGGALLIVGRRVDLRDGGAFILLARRATGDVRVAFDWRALAALFLGILALMVVRGRR